MRFKLTGDLRGGQLAREIEAATGVAVDVTFYPPDEVEVTGDVTEAQVAPIVAAHSPQEAPSRTARRLVLAAASSAVGKRLDALTAAEVRALLALLLWKAGGVDGVKVKGFNVWL